jgi:chromosomal replication initiator protein
MEAITTSSLANAISVLVWYNKYLENIIKTQAEFRNGSIEELIIKTVCRWYDVDFSLVRSSSRRVEVAIPRHLICYLLRHYAGYTYERIGQVVNRKHHTTVINSCQTTEDLLFSNPSFKQLYKLIANDIEQTIGFPISDLKKSIAMGK